MKKLSHKKMFFLFTFIFIIFVLTTKVSALTIVLDPGHGGNDSGASKGSLIEKDITLKIAKYLRDNLNEYENVNVLLTHNGDTMSLQDRADFARNHGADLLVSIHINSSTSVEKDGAEVYVTYRTDLPKYNQEMTILGNRVLNNISALGISNNGVKTKIAINDNEDPEYKYFDGSNGDYYGIIRRAMKGGNVTDLGDDFSDGSGVPAILIEHAHLSNSHDINFLNSDSKLKQLAYADCQAIVEQYNLTKNTPIDVSGYLFNSKYYADMNKDLKNLFGYNEQLLFDHYKTFGIKEGRKASVVFDAKYYLNKYPDLKSAFGNNYMLAYEHFVACGAKEGRAGSKYFDGKYYLNSYADLKSVFNNNYTKGLEHFVLCGINEKRIGSNEFNIKDYYNNCSKYEKNKLGSDYLKYYEYAQGGDVINENQIDITNNLFDANTYYNLYPDLQSAFGYNIDLLKEHYYTCGIKEGRRASVVFDAKYYLNRYPDLKNVFGNNFELAYQHFVNCGINEGRRGSNEFDVKYYLNRYEDLSNIFGNNYSKALDHYVTFGKNEGRKRSFKLI